MRYLLRCSILAFVSQVSDTIHQTGFKSVVFADTSSFLLDLHTKTGTATGADGKPITNIKFPHVGGHEGVGRIVAFGPNTSPSEGFDIGTLVGIRFLSRICHECEYCTTGREQHCGKATNHLHHEDGSFQEYCVLDTNYLTVLPQDIDPKAAGPALCAGVTAYKVGSTERQKAEAS